VAEIDRPVAIGGGRSIRPWWPACSGPARASSRATRSEPSEPWPTHCCIWRT